MLQPRFFNAIGTLRHADRLGFLTQDARAAGTVLGFFGAAAALGARPDELVLMVCRRHSAADLHRQVVLVFQQNAGLADELSRLYRAHGRPLGFEAQKRWCAIPEPAFLADETFALLAARFPNLLLIEQDAAGKSSVAVYASAGFREHPQLKIAPLAGRVAAAASAPRAPAKVTPLPRRVIPVPPRPMPQSLGNPMAPVVPLRPRKLKSVVALNETVEKQVVSELRRLIRAVSHYS
jgi:hypothetical protein